jgi:signal transduction histidine kinase
MLDLVLRLFDPSGFTPRARCGDWSGGLVALHVVSDVLIGLAYLAIPLVLLVLVRRRDVPFRGIFILFGVFIVSCGLTHFLDATSFYVPLYRLSGLVLLLTAAASWATVLALIPVVPRALALRTPREWDREVRERRRVEEAAAQRAREQDEVYRRDVADRRRAEEALRELTASLERRVAERTAALEQQARDLRELNRQLVRSNQELDDFAHIASHDLKEPLRGIANYSQFLLEDYGDQFDAEGRHKLETLGQLSRRMSALIDSLHQFSRLGRVELGVAATDLGEVVAGVLEGLRITLEERQVEVRIPRPLPVVPCDRVRVGEIFHNLIVNAVKYNDKPQRWVEIGVTAPARPGGPDVFYIRDNGIGIRERHLEAVFQMFKRLHARDVYGGGTGVGLTIAKRIVERHGGRIWAESVHGQGATFYFTLAPDGEAPEEAG